MPRESKYTPAVHATIVRALEEGLSRRAAANIAGLTDRTLRTWMASESEEFEKLQVDVLTAEANVEKTITVALVDAAKAGDMRAAQFYLERRVPEWRQKSEQNVTANVAATPAAAAAAVREAFGERGSVGASDDDE